MLPLPDSTGLCYWPKDIRATAKPWEQLALYALPTPELCTHGDLHSLSTAYVPALCVSAQGAPILRRGGCPCLECIKSARAQLPAEHVAGSLSTETLHLSEPMTVVLKLGSSFPSLVHQQHCILIKDGHSQPNKERLTSPNQRSRPGTPTFSKPLLAESRERGDSVSEYHSPECCSKKQSQEEGLLP